jgi:hypothetical protein
LEFSGAQSQGKKFIGNTTYNMRNSVPYETLQKRRKRIHLKDIAPLADIEVNVLPTRKGIPGCTCHYALDEIN